MDVTFFKRDSKMLSEGIWIKDIPGMGDVEFKVRGYSSPEVMASRSAKERKVPLSERMEDGSLKSETTLRIFREVLMDTIFMDVRNLTHADGKPVKAEEAKMWLLDPDYEPLADAVFMAAQLVDRKRSTTQETVAGN